jgi:hypothetical protein
MADRRRRSGNAFDASRPTIEFYRNRDVIDLLLLVA